MEEHGSPEQLSEVLSRLFVARGWGQRQSRLQLERAWLEIAGEEFATHSRVSGMRRHILEIEVRSTVHLQELAQFHKRRLLAALREKLPNLTINDLKFRAGTWLD